MVPLIQVQTQNPVKENILDSAMQLLQPGIFSRVFQSQEDIVRVSDHHKRCRHFMAVASGALYPSQRDILKRSKIRLKDRRIFMVTLGAVVSCVAHVKIRMASALNKADRTYL